MTENNEAKRGANLLNLIMVTSPDKIALRTPS
jgi:hypothetical protein